MSPTYVAVLKNSRHADEARAFIHYLLSPKGQRILADANTGKYPVAPLSADNPRAAQQQRLMAQPPLNYRLILKRQQLVQRMFDTAISFRLAQLKDAWRALHSAETRLKRPLPEIRALLTSVPVDAASSEDETGWRSLIIKALPNKNDGVADLVSEQSAAGDSQTGRAEMKGRLLQRLRQLSISNSLRGAFLTGALLTLIVSMVSLYSRHEQSSQVRYSLDEYFPRIHSAFLIEGNLNLAVDQLNEFLLAPNTTVRLQLRTQIIQHLDKIERLSQGLQLAERRQLAVILQDSRTLLAELDNALYNMFLVREKVSELSARIDWLHDDFTTELNSLVQDFTRQQGTLLDQIEANQGDAAQYLQRSREVQNEQQQVYTPARIENQIVDDLRDRLNELKSGNNDGMLVETHIRYLENLKKNGG